MMSAETSLAIHKIWFVCFYGQFYFLNDCVTWGLDLARPELTPLSAKIQWGSGGKAIPVWTTFLSGLFTDYLLFRLLIVIKNAFKSESIDTKLLDA